MEEKEGGKDETGRTDRKGCTGDKKLTINTQDGMGGTWEI